MRIRWREMKGVAGAAIGVLAWTKRRRVMHGILTASAALLVVRKGVMELRKRWQENTRSKL